MALHWTYCTFDPSSDLQQGDILSRTDELLAVLKNVHSYFCDERYLAFIVVTQSCDLVRRKAILEEQVKQFSTREASSQAQNELSRTSNENIRVIERANVPTRGKSLKREAAILSVLFAAFTAFAAGLMRAFSRTTFPTPSSIGRTLGLPILATVTR